jgi:peptidoglycan/LPS O-acetylase OafA/YrhL
VRDILLLVIGLAAPWTVHLASPRQRPLALVAVIAVLLLFGIFASNPLASWGLWAGLAVGLASVLLLAGGALRGGASPPAPRPHRPRGDTGSERTDPM